MKCPSCNERLTRSVEHGATLIKSRYILIEADGSVQVACKNCGALGPLPPQPPRIGIKRHGN